MYYVWKFNSSPSIHTAFIRIAVEYKTINLSILSGPLGVMGQPQVPQSPVETLLLLRSCAHSAGVHLLLVAATTRAGGCHGCEVAEVVCKEPDGIVWSGFDHFEDSSAEQVSHPCLWQKLPVAVRFGGFTRGHPRRINPGPAFLLVRHYCWRPVSQQRQRKWWKPGWRSRKRRKIKPPLCLARCKQYTSRLFILPLTSHQKAFLKQKYKHIQKKIFN